MNTHAKTKKIYVTDFDKKIGQNLKTFRIEKKLSVAEISEKLYISHQQYRKYEKGVNRLSLARFIQMSKNFDLDTSLFLKSLEQDDAVKK